MERNAVDALRLNDPPYLHVLVQWGEQQLEPMTLGEQEHVNALMFNYDYLVVQKVPPHIFQATPVRYQ